ncbi:MAG: ABC transporter substrate-binding protein [Ramlibacter sp.]|nr:ABC transporter substrate-binding protein [Ramlibacter sp.]
MNAFSRVAAAVALTCLLPLSHAADKWVVGQSAPLTGSNGEFGTATRDGANAWFAALNAKGGVAGRQIELLTLDDKNSRKTAGENTKTLLQNVNLVALFGYGSATLSLDSLPQAEAAGVAFVAPFSGAEPVRKNTPSLFTIRASYGEEMEKMLNFWTSLGLKRVSVVHYDDEVGKQNLDVVAAYLKKAGLVPQGLSLKRNAPVGKAEAQALIAQQPEVILNTVLSGAAAQIQKEMVAAGRLVPTSSLSFVGADQFIAAAGPASAGVSISQVVPNTRSPMPAVRECAKALEAAGIKEPMNSTHLEACFGARVVAEAIRRARKPVSAQTVRDALANLGTLDLGGYQITFAPGAHHGSKYVELAMVTRDGKLTGR